MRATRQQLRGTPLLSKGDSALFDFTEQRALFASNC